MKRLLLVVTLCAFCAAGCDSLRFAPDETQKQNAWLHNRTALLAADMASSLNVSEPLKDLTNLCEVQSRSLIADYGLPKNFPPADSIEGILSEANFKLAETALSRASQRPDIWDTADGVIDLGIGIAALLGGIYGVRIAGFLRQAGAKSKAERGA